MGCNSNIPFIPNESLLLWFVYIISGFYKPAVKLLICLQYEFLCQKRKWPFEIVFFLWEEEIFMLPLQTQINSKKTYSLLKWKTVSPQEKVISVSVTLNFHPTPTSHVSHRKQERRSIVCFRHRQSSLISSSLHFWKGNSPGTIFVSMRQDRSKTINALNS